MLGLSGSSSHVPEAIMLQLYFGSIVVGSLYGLFEGVSKWSSYIKTREAISIKGFGDFDSLLSGLANAGKDAGLLGFNIMIYTVLSGFIVATAPVSVPLIIFMSKKSEAKDA